MRKFDENFDAAIKRHLSSYQQGFRGLHKRLEDQGTYRKLYTYFVLVI